MEQLKPPNSLCFEGNLAENWRTWVQKFDLYLIATGIGEKSTKVQCATFLHVAGDEAIKVFNTMDFDDDVDDLDVLKRKFQEYCEPRKNITYMRHLFFTRAQGPKETIDSYVTELKNKAKDCGFAQLHDELIKDRIVCGITSDTVRARLLRETNLDLARAVDICRASELTQSHMKALHEEADVAVNKVNVTRKKPERQARVKQERENEECTRCGYTHEPRKCPAYGKICNDCQGKNHFSRMCKSKKQKTSFKSRKSEKKVHEMREEENEDSDELFLGSIEVMQAYVVPVDTVSMQQESQKWKQELKINDCMLNLKLDTGAECNVLSVKDFRKVANERALLKSSCKLVTYSGHTMEPKGKAILKCDYKGNECHLEFQVVERDSPAILGRDACSRLGLVKRVYKLERNDNTDILSEYQDLFTGLGCVPGKHHIEVDPNVAPVIHAPRRVPVALKDKIKTELKRMEDKGVIVKQTEPTDWVNSMVTVVKPNKQKIRICIDPQDLNKAIRREHYPLRTIEEVVAEMPNARIFSVVDANHGFWQVQLDEESSKLCTFNTPFGRYRFLRLPFGVSSAPEVFQKCIAQRLEGLEGVVNVVDDILVWGEDEEQHDRRLRQLLDRIRSINLKLNKEKCKFRTTEVTYVGHVLTADGLKPDQEKVRAVQNMPEPEDKAGLMRFLGMLQYLAKFVPNLSEESAPLRTLLDSKVAWHWESEQQKSFEKLKQLVSSAPVLKYYDVHKEVTLSVDASSEGLGAVLLQDGQPVAYGSRSLTDCEKRYAQIEKELLAIVYGCEKFNQYVYGKTVQVETDHKPLETVFKKALQKAPLRLQRMLMRLQPYDLRVNYKPGKELHIADALSRAYLKGQPKKTNHDDELQVHPISARLPITEEKLQIFRTATAADEDLQRVVRMIQSGWPNEIRQVPENMKKYWTYKEELTCEDGLLFKNTRIVVPQCLRAEMLQRIHESHLGVVKCKDRARDVMFWPNMAKEIEELVLKCSTCNTFRRNNTKEPLISHDIPERAWAKVGVDLFHYEQGEYILCVDYYSKFPEIAKLTHTTTKHVVTALKSMFARHGIPDEVVSDNGPQFSSAEFGQFSDSWEFTHTTSSPGFPQSNGQSERAIQTIKNMLKKAQESQSDPYIALLEYRNAPLDGVKLSPAQLLMGRRLKTRLPTSAQLLKPQLYNNVQERIKNRQVTQKAYHDRGAKQLPSLAEGEKVRVRVKNNWQPATVVRSHDKPRSLIIETPDGGIYRRNRRHLLKTREMTFPPSQAPDIEDCRSVDSTPAEAYSPVQSPAQTPRKVSVTPSAYRHSPRKDTVTQSQNGEQVKRSRFGRVIRPPRSYSP